MPSRDTTSNENSSYVRLVACGDVPDNEVIQACPAGHEPVAVYRFEEEFFVTDDMCTHGEASLADGEITPEGNIVCPFHFGEFDIRTGEAAQYPCTEPLTVYPVRVVDGFVYADLQSGHTP